MGWRLGWVRGLLHFFLFLVSQGMVWGGDRGSVRFFFFFFLKCFFGLEWVEGEMDGVVFVL